MITPHRKAGFFRVTYLVLLVAVPTVPPGPLHQHLLLLQVLLLVVLRLWHLVVALPLPQQPPPLQATLLSLFHWFPSQVVPLVPLVLVLLQQRRGRLLLVPLLHQLAHSRCLPQHS
ncbi:hypothetical protein PG996_006889 [Apiospora saccharicola]|uniref:Secreted peptide n=1 Tax=Apiospora saccharicola TaxID=335842 RepID=A0ABR1VA54_9PEZI